MKYIKTLKAIYLFVFLNLPFQVFSQASDGVVVDEIIGRIDDYIVLRSELESTYLEILSRGERISGNTKCAVLKDLITNKLLVAKAEIDSVIVEDGQVDQELNSRMALIINQIGSEEEIERYLILPFPSFFLSESVTTASLRILTELNFSIAFPENTPCVAQL